VKLVANASAWLKAAVWAAASRLGAVQAALAAFAARCLSVSSPPSGDAPRNVIVVRLDEIGDMVMFSPFLRGLRRGLPEARITLVVKPAVRDFVACCPYVDEVLAFDQSGGRARRFAALPWRAWRFGVRLRRGRRFDLAVLPRWDADYYYGAFVALWSGAARRVGYSERVTPYKKIVNRGFDRLLTDVLDDRSVRHDIAHNAEMLRFLGIAPDGEALEAWADDSDAAFAEETLRAAGIGPEEMLVGIGPSGGHSVLKQWPVERFAEVGWALREQHGARVLVFGGPGEEALGAALTEVLGPTALSLVGRTTLRQMAALMARCRVYVGNDSGPTHIAAAVGIPVVAVFGSSCRHRFRPGGRSLLVWRELDCGPCRRTGHKENRCHVCIYDAPLCLTDISAEEVAQAAARQLLDPVTDHKGDDFD